jgi:hypothetical protein
MAGISADAARTSAFVRRSNPQEGMVQIENLADVDFLKGSSPLHGASPFGAPSTRNFVG